MTRTSRILLIAAAASLLAAGTTFAEPTSQPQSQPQSQPLLPTGGQPAPPPDPISEVAPARARYQASETRLQNTRDDLTEFVRVQRMLFETSQQFRSAVAEQAAAHRAWSAARAETIASLEESDPDYVEGKRLRDQYARQIEQARAQRQSDRASLDGLIINRQSLSSRITAREVEALSRDARVTAARERLATAADRVETMRREFTAKLRASDALAAARRDVHDAAEQQAYAATYARSTVRTANVLMDYAYYTAYLSTLRPYVLNPSYAPYYGYGATYGTGYNAAYTAPSSGIGYGLIPGQ